tara:strand:- start:133 stop:381 length:249 start_codon:yes stop_codon:yes gene_type:complete
VVLTTGSQGFAPAAKRLAVLLLASGVEEEGSYSLGINAGHKKNMKGQRFILLIFSIERFILKSFRESESATHSVIIAFPHQK